MPFDAGNYKFKKNAPDFSAEERHVYVCENGNIRLETRRFRHTFAPEEFVKLLRSLLLQTRRGGDLPIIQKQTSLSFCQRFCMEKAKNRRS